MSDEEIKAIILKHKGFLLPILNEVKLLMKDSTDDQVVEKVLDMIKYVKLHPMYADPPKINFISDLRDTLTPIHTKRNDYNDFNK